MSFCKLVMRKSKNAARSQTMRDFREINSTNWSKNNGYESCLNHFTDVYNSCVSKCVDKPSSEVRNYKNKTFQTNKSKNYQVIYMYPCPMLFLIKSTGVEAQLSDFFSPQLYNFKL